MALQYKILRSILTKNQDQSVLEEHLIKMGKVNLKLIVDKGTVRVNLLLILEEIKVGYHYVHIR